jgi:hypothetical protein
MKTISMSDVAHNHQVVGNLRAALPDCCTDLVMGTPVNETSSAARRRVESI